MILILLLLLAFLLPVLIHPSKHKTLVIASAIILGIFEGLFKATGAKKDWDSKRK